MKFITVIFNILITKSLCNPVYKYQLQDMYENEKNMYFNNTVNDVVNQIYTQVISNAKQNINTTYFDLWYQYFFNKQLKAANLEYYQNQHYFYSVNKKNTQQIRYTECYNYLYNQYNKVNHFPVSSTISYFDQDPLYYDISIELYISTTLYKISTIFPDCNLVKLHEPQSCTDEYLISW